ncbi:hypothetical protein HYPSUDRAFT_144808 [Hypholoma sublateritium FD-334 SS-4]|uniref:UFSP1/2/DUB catalytic domain-containing protein n=1 Tax=Hypholoma sublateritium (strain FD-334 SS-4) TaxID=945553 RepID=A0A0D2KVB7_HYPSF|nr:hypothetical protein HYPSUDRAFT_144808 [Hypholoma sublateritium FD-334 SS-4]
MLSNALAGNDTDESASFLCAFCSAELCSLSIAQREAHYDLHLNDDSAELHEALPVKSSPNILPKKKLRWGKQSDTFWYAGLDTPPPRNYVPAGLIHVLRKGLAKGHNRGNIRRAALCVENAVLIHREVWDAQWGCGYRNFLMACATLMNQKQQLGYFSLLDSPIPPSVRNLQTWIESAWEEGFDAEGKKDLKELIGTRKWIGTADIWVAFVSRRIPAQLVDFDLQNKSEGMEIQAIGTDALIDWVVEYFTPKGSQEKATNAFDSLKVSSIMSTNKMPLILQHAGHSRTVVGYEIDKKGATNLLIFDPALVCQISCSSARSVLLSLSFPLTANSNIGAIPTAPAKNQMENSHILKRKRSMDSSLNKPTVDENGKIIPSESPARFSTSVKNSLSKVGVGRKIDPDLYEIVKKFRLEPKKLQKKKQYQILYFPVTAPLSETERKQKRQVTSIKIT